MEKELLEKELLEKVINIIEKTGDFVTEQAPEIVQHFYYYHMVSIILWIIITLISAFISFKYGMKLYRGGYKYKEDPLYLHMGTLFFIIIMFCKINELLKLIIAPKLYMIEHFIK